MRIVIGLLIIAVAMLIAVGGLVVVQRLFPLEQRRQHNDVAGFIYAVLGVAYAVLLGLMLIAVWEQWEAAEDTVTEEANEVAEIFWLAHRVPQPEGRHVQELARSYARVVVEDEWPAMQEGKASPKAWDVLDKMRGIIEGINPTEGAQLSRYDQVLEQMHGLDDARRGRLLAAEEGLPTILWVVLVLGGVITVGFTYLFGLENTVVHTLMVAALAMIVSLTLFTVAALDYPFRGDVRIHPTAFEQVQVRFHDSNLNDLRE